MSLDTALRNLAQRAVHGMGTSVTLKRVTVGAYSTTAGTVATTEQSQTLTGRLDEYTDREIQGTIKTGDRKVLIAALDLTWAPAVKDKVTLEGVDLDVVNVKRDMAASLPVLYTLQVRG